ncbi:hypothetical protein Avbf_08516 [Armadillidium vulgare]|nr:hypothetical protein Avbf_08516 [Armadillidium vulgare]
MLEIPIVKRPIKLITKAPNLLINAPVKRQNNKTGQTVDSKYNSVLKGNPKANLCNLFSLEFLVFTSPYFALDASHLEYEINL